MHDLRYSHILTHVLSALWAILPTKLSIILDVLAYRAAGGALTEEEIQQRIGAIVRPQARAQSGALVLPLQGVLIPRGDMLAESSGAMSVEHFISGFRQGLMDPAVSAIVLDVNSPGGEVMGIPEAAAEIYRARGVKPVLAVANHLAASAAYWLAAQADELYSSPSGETGSIGVLAVHEDLSRKLDQAGVSTTLITAGKFKGEGNPFAPLSEEAKTHVQGRVDEYYAMFTAAVARGRGVSVEQVRTGFGEGRVLGAKAARAEHMIDGIATLDEVVALAARRARQQGMSAISMSAENWSIENGGETINGGAAQVTLYADSTLLAGPLPVHHTPTVDVPWDGPANEGRIPNDAGAVTLRKAYAWQDMAADPDTKKAYKFVHHMCSMAGEIGPANTTACTAGIGVLNGGMAGTTIPKADHKGVHAHLAAHLRDAGRVPPPLRSQAAATAELELRQRRQRIVSFIQTPDSPTRM